MKPRLITAVGIGLGLTAGGGAVAIAGIPGLAGATAPAALASDDGSPTDPPSTTDPSTTDPSSTETHTRPERVDDRIDEHLGEVLQPLIDDGTLTQDQADRVVEALGEALPFGGGRGWGRAVAACSLETAAETIGITTDELRDALADDASIAEVAADHGVDAQAVIDALVAEATSHLDEQVAEGALDADTAAARTERLADAITDLVERDGGVRLAGPGGRGAWGPHRRDGRAAPSDDAPVEPNAPSAPEQPAAPSTTTGG